MIVYRITLKQFSHQLYASGRVARWNSKGTFVIYTAGSRSLACLENLVHRSGEGLDAGFRVMVIEIPNEVKMEQVASDDLPTTWRDFSQQYATRAVGDRWINEGKSAVLRVPSAIIPEEFNYLINPHHKDFERITLLGVDPFSFDKRL